MFLKYIYLIFIGFLIRFLYILSKTGLSDSKNKSSLEGGKCMRKKSYNVFIAWILAICMIFTGVGLYDTTSYAAGEVTPGDKEYTITFDYGINEEALANNDYTYKGVTYAKSVTVKEGQTLEDI
jgi:hypothetical protein